MRKFWRGASATWPWRRLFIVAAAATGFYILFLWRLGTLTPGLGATEYNSYQFSQNANGILQQGINAPYHLVQNLILKTPLDTIWSLRLSSVFFGSIVLISAVFFLRNWFGTMTAALAGMVLATTPWIILTVRSGEPSVMFLWPVVIFACLNWLMRTPEKANKLWLVVCAAVAIGLYTPGIIWLLLATFILGRHSIKNMLQIVGRLRMAFGVMAGIIILLPLARAIFLDPQLVNNILLIPNDWPPLVEALKSIAWSGLALVWHTRGGIDIVIDRLALLNLAQIILSVFGIYALLTRVRRVTLVAFGWLAFSIVVAGINTDLHLLSIGLPAVFLFMSAGLRFLYLEWRRIFPLNPFARALSITLILLVIGVHGAYGVRYALAAWPQTEATKKSYVLQ